MVLRDETISTMAPLEITPMIFFFVLPLTTAICLLLLDTIFSDASMRLSPSVTVGAPVIRFLILESPVMPFFLRSVP